MVLCWAPGCSHYNQRETCKFFTFPKDPKLRNKWKQLVRRTVEPGRGACLCSCHFPEGRKENGPKLFKHNEEKRFQFSSPEKKRRKCVEDSHEIAPTVELSDLYAPNIGQPDQSLEETHPHLLEQITSEHCAESTPLIESEPEPSTSQEPQPSTSKQASSPATPAVLKAENYFLQQEIASQTRKLEYSSNKLTFDSIANSNEMVLLYTGLPSTKIFNSLYELVKDLNIKYYFKWNVEKLNRKDQLLLTLMKLRQNSPHLDLAHRFGISQSAVSNIVITWVHVLHKILFKKFMGEIPN